ncbi:MAG: PorP/SprF family type IX secretion system membrane protein [Flavobacteriales bacterium]|nr:PorP/SprF family type IX secretion system membrane protein [Flavobacteriales bacterium]
MAATLTLAPMGLLAQDAHLSQYDAGAVLLNPALTGMYEQSDFRIASNLRSQWSSLSSAFITTAFAYDLNFQQRYGAGLYMCNYDQAGMMTTFEGGFTGSYNVSQKNAKHTLSVGVRAGLIYKKVNDADLLFDAQYNNGYFDQDLPSGEMFNKRGRLMPDLGLGFAYRSVHSMRMFNPFGNFAAYHITRPDESIFRVGKTPMPIRWTAMGGVTVTINERFRFSPMGLFMQQNKDREINAGVLGECAIGDGVYHALLGGSYRVGDAIIVQTGIKHKNSAFRMSYDVNISPLSTFTRNRGAFEFSIIYYGTHNGRERRTQRSSF